MTLAKAEAGYRVSETNYLGDSEETKNGWNKYGALSDSPYAPYQSKFIDFILYYSGCSSLEIPDDQDDLADWIESNQDMIQASEDFDVSSLQEGDLVFVQNADEEIFYGFVVDTAPLEVIVPINDAVSSKYSSWFEDKELLGRLRITDDGYGSSGTGSSTTSDSLGNSDSAAEDLEEADTDRGRDKDTDSDEEADADSGSDAGTDTSAETDISDSDEGTLASSADDSAANNNMMGNLNAGGVVIL